MPLQRYKEERNGVVFNENGNLVKFEHVRQLINDVYDRHRDTGSQEFDGGVIDVIADLMDSIGLDTHNELKR